MCLSVLMKRRTLLLVLTIHSVVGQVRYLVTNRYSDQSERSVVDNYWHHPFRSRNDRQFGERPARHFHTLHRSSDKDTSRQFTASTNRSLPTARSEIYAPMTLATDDDTTTLIDRLMVNKRKFGLRQSRNVARNVLRAAVIAPNSIEQKYSLKEILPAITLAARKIESDGRHGRGPLPGWDIQIVHRDSRCSSIHGPLQVFELYNNKAIGGAPNCSLFT